MSDVTRAATCEYCRTYNEMQHDEKWTGSCRSCGAPLPEPSLRWSATVTPEPLRLTMGTQVYPYVNSTIIGRW